MKYIPRILRSYLRPYSKLAGLSVLITILVSAATLLAPWPLKIIFDSVLGREPLPAVLNDLDWMPKSAVPLLIAAVIASLLIAFLENALHISQSYVSTTLEQRMVLDFRSDLFRHAQSLSFTFHDHRRTGGLIYAINYQAYSAANVIMAIQPMAQSLLILGGMAWITFSIDPVLAMIALSVLPFVYYSIHYYAKRIQPQILATQVLEGQSISIIHEAMQMLRVMVAFGREPFEYRRFRQQGEQAINARIKVTVRQTVFSLAVNMITAIGTALVLGFGAYQVLQNRITPGQLLVVLAYIAAVYGPLEAISGIIADLQERFVSLRMAYGLLDTVPEIEEAPDAITLDKAQGNIKMEGVYFNYTGRRDALKDISFEVGAGQVVAIVGPTGAGKTTLISMLPRFYDPKKGSIFLDGVDIRKITLKSLREQFALVLQEPLLFSGSIADNIRYGRLEATMEEVMEAAKAANAHDFIMALPKKYDTTLGERGVQLSGGERQRISVARAFLKDAPILILDEPTSSIDSKTEAVILDALDRLMEGRTTFIVAHRLSTIRQADYIIVMNQGELVEQGTHEELIEKDGLYKQLYEMQVGQLKRRPLRKLDPNLPLPEALLTTTSANAQSEEAQPEEPHREERERELATAMVGAGEVAHGSAEPEVSRNGHVADGAGAYMHIED